ncbi:Crp/Fnr family transcriptional regulator [Paenibacillus kribbensis]|uniref:Crp/Fnr family transcriptional regulator n=1 Tax=Paenibacillus kribbensis TaxID=172713 RepID=UPI0015BB44A7|nr:Crp/Fnr family transcriptional regulator [Paenibacillus kribbensis]
MKSILFKYMTKFTFLNDEEQQAIAEKILIEEYKKGTVLLRQGDVPTTCYFVLKGCVRQYLIDETGKEVTSNFYTEEQAVSIFNRHQQIKPSAYTFTCLEDCVLVVGDLVAKKDMLDEFSQLESMIRKMVEENNRVPQHQLASYLGITPESLSRIKKRINTHDF